ncbi:delta-aminolevulinic acid dehydratase [candidate division WOR-3 bacterium]|nr:delta-aminolevulinic acid dehydratase [candidate division WOR-3 bacterium]
MKSVLVHCEMEVKGVIEKAMNKLVRWLEINGCESYDPFDGLKSPVAGYLTLNNKYLRGIWQQFFKRCPINFRPIASIKREINSKTMGDIATAYLMLYKLYNDEKYLNKTIFSLKWLEDNFYRGYSGYCWGNYFDCQTRGIYAKKGTPNIFTTYYNANAFLDAYELLGNSKYLEVAKSACNFILKDIGFTKDKDALCISYYPTQKDQIHNVNILGASLLSRVYKYTREEDLFKIANKAVKYTIQCQREDGAWFYGKEPMYHWIDNFHTGYILESLYNYINHTGDSEFMLNLLKGIEFYRTNFFLANGIPKYYDNKIYPIDIQCAAQAIQTFAILSSIDKKYLDMAIKVAKWTIENMQDKNGYFYYRKYQVFTNKIPYMRWGESTMFVALVNLIRVSQKR